MNSILWSPVVVDVGERIAELKLGHAAELQRYLEVVYGIRAVTSLVALTQPADTLIPPTPPAPTKFRVVLDGYEPFKKIGVIKLVRELTGLGLKEAKDLVESAPQSIKEGVTKEEAARLKDKLTTVGATVAVVGC